MLIHTSFDCVSGCSHYNITACETANAPVANTRAEYPRSNKAAPVARPWLVPGTPDPPTLRTRATLSAPVASSERVLEAKEPTRASFTFGLTLTALH